jgi:hypothetical protein
MYRPGVKIFPGAGDSRTAETARPHVRVIVRELVHHLDGLCGIQVGDRGIWRIGIADAASYIEQRLRRPPES